MSQILYKLGSPISIVLKLPLRSHIFLELGNENVSWWSFTQFVFICLQRGMEFNSNIDLLFLHIGKKKKPVLQSQDFSILHPELESSRIQVFGAIGHRREFLPGQLSQDKSIFTSRATDTQFPARCLVLFLGCKFFFFRNKLCIFKCPVSKFFVIAQ